MLSDVPYSYSGSGTGSNAGSGAEQDSSEPPPATAEPPLTIILEYPVVGTGEKTWQLTAPMLERWREAYPNLDVLSECRKALEWAFANEQKRKTAKGMPAFLVNWFNKATNQTRGGAAPSRPTSKPYQTRGERETSSILDAVNSVLNEE